MIENEEIIYLEFICLLQR